MNSTLAKYDIYYDLSTLVKYDTHFIRSTLTKYDIGLGPIHSILTHNKYDIIIFYTQCINSLNIILGLHIIYIVH